MAEVKRQNRNPLFSDLEAAKLPEAPQAPPDLIQRLHQVQEALTLELCKLLAFDPVLVSLDWQQEVQATLDRLWPQIEELVLAGQAPGAKPAAWSELVRPGQVFLLNDGSRGIVLANQGGPLDLLRICGGAVTRERFDPEEPDQNGRVAGIDPRPEARLIPGTLNAEPLSPDKRQWQRLQPGSILRCPDGRWAEVLAIKPIPGLGSAHRALDLLEHGPDGVRYAPEQACHDIDLQDRDAPEIYLNMPVDSLAPASRNEVCRASLEPTVLTPAAAALSRFWIRQHAALQERLAGVSDRLVLHRVWQRAEADQAADPAAAREDFTLNLLARKELMRRAEVLTAGVLRLLGAAGLSEIASVTPSGESLSARLGAALQEGSSAGGLLDRAAEARLMLGAFIDACAAAPPNNTPEGRRYAGQVREQLERYCAGVEDFEELLQATEAAATDAVDFSFATRMESAETIDHDTLEQVCRLAQGTKRARDDQSFLHRGGLIFDYHSPHELRRLLEQEARLITHRETRLATAQEQITGFILYFEPGRAPPAAEAIYQAYLKEVLPTAGFDPARCALVDAMAVGPEGGAAIQRLLDRKTIELLPTGAKWSLGEIMFRNGASFNTMLANGAFPLTGGYVLRHAPESGQRLGYYLLLAEDDPELAAAHIAFRAMRRPLRRLFAAQAELEPHAHEYAVYRAREEARDRASVRYYCAQENLAKVFVHIGWGAESISREAAAAAEAILCDGLYRARGVITDNSTVMAERIDGRLTGRLRPGLHTAMRRVRAEADPGAVFISANVYDPQTTAAAEVPGLNDGSPVPVIRDEPGAPFLTLADPAVPPWRRFMYAAAEDGHLDWGQEERAKRHLAELYAEENGFANVFIFAGGGGALARSIEQTVAYKQAHPEREILIVLIDPPLSGAPRGSTAVDRCMHEAWMTQYGRYVQVVRDGETLNRLLSTPAIEAAQPLPEKPPAAAVSAADEALVRR